MENNSLFDQDRMLWRVMSRMVDVLIISVIFTLSCIPIITIGASATAVYYVFLRIFRGQEGYLVKGYFKSFKQNFKQATIVWIVLLAIAAFIAGDVYYYYIQNTTASTVIMAFVAGLSVIWLLVFIYIFPLISRFSNSTGTFFKMALFMPFKHIKWTACLLGMAVGIGFLGWYIIPFAFIAYGVFAYASCYVIVKIFKPYEEAIEAKMEKESQKEEE